MTKRTKKTKKTKNSRFTWYSESNHGLFATITNQRPYQNGNWILIGIFETKNKIYYEYEKIILHKGKQ